MANLLSRMSVSFVTIDKKTTTISEPRAVSIDDESMRALQAAGLSEAVQRITVRGYGSIYYGPKGQPFTQVKPASCEYGFDKRNAFHQPELEKIMEDALTVSDNDCGVMFETGLTHFGQTADYVNVICIGSDQHKMHIKTKYMVACDGGKSSVRKSLNIAMSGLTFEEPWLIVDLKSTQNRSFHTEVFCDPVRPGITLPGPRGTRRYEYKLHKGEDHEAVVKPEFVRKLLARFGPDAQEDLERILIYAFHARIAEKWREKRVFLAGDAAHLTPPFSGQGMNSGLRDAHNLAWKLAQACFSENACRLLDSYEAERRPHAWQMIKMARRMGQVMMPNSALRGAILRGLFHAVNVFPPARNYFSQMKFKSKPRFCSGMIRPDHFKASGTLIGQMLCQPIVETVDAERFPLDALLPDQPIVLIYAECPEKMLNQSVIEQLLNHGAALFGITPEYVKPVDAKFPIVRDQAKFFSQKPYAHYLGHAFLIRRDRYIAASAPCHNSIGLLEALHALTPN
ncbi:MAG: FAD-dependent monooxygenase [Paracoccaceae bacterium]|nr:FAD-dependent monooxygenase [Paracoccaceae bacterium]